jgi:uncharacterized protein (TIGR02646 family)
MIRVHRREVAPASLATIEKRPFKEDVLQALHDDFHGKCYLCEGLAAESFDVEHLHPVTDFAELAFEWKNLFLAHARCNQRRKTWSAAERACGKKRWPEGGMLDCTTDDVEDRLRQELTTVVSGVSIRFAEVESNDRAAFNTTVELNAIHSKDHFWGRQLCSLVETQYERALRAYEDLRVAVTNCRNDWDGAEVREAADHFKDFIIPSAPYAGLIRNKFRVMLPPEWCLKLAL